MHIPQILATLYTYLEVTCSCTIIENRINRLLGTMQDLIGASLRYFSAKSSLIILQFTEVVNLQSNLVSAVQVIATYCQTQRHSPDCKLTFRHGNSALEQVTYMGTSSAVKCSFIRKLRMLISVSLFVSGSQIRLLSLESLRPIRVFHSEERSISPIWPPLLWSL